MSLEVRSTIDTSLSSILEIYDLLCSMLVAQVSLQYQHEPNRKRCISIIRIFSSASRRARRGVQTARLQRAVTARDDGRACFLCEVPVFLPDFNEYLSK